MGKKAFKATRVTLIVSGILMVVCGILIFCLPDTVSWLIGAVLALTGIFNIVLYIKDARQMTLSGLLLSNGVMDLIFAALFFVLSRGITSVLTVLFSLMLIAIGFSLLTASGIVRKLFQTRAWIAFLVLGFAVIALGIVSVANPGDGQIGQQIFGITLGVLLIAMGGGYFYGAYKLKGAEKIPEKMNAFIKGGPDQTDQSYFHDVDE